MRIEYGFTDLVLTSHAGLPALAQVLKAARLPAAFGPSLKTIPDADIFPTAAALLALGKCDFEAMSTYRDDPSFPRLLSLKRLPSAEILRQRLDSAPPSLDEKLAEANVRMLEAHAQPLAGKHGFVPLVSTRLPWTTPARTARASPGPTRALRATTRCSATWASRAISWPSSYGLAPSTRKASSFPSSSGPLPGRAA